MEHITIETEDLAILGEQKPGTLVYTREGSLEKVADWFDRISVRFGATVTLGGVMMYCPVSRSALHERIDRGGLTVFEFNVTERKTNLLGSLKTVFRKTYAYVPIAELHAWRKDIEERAKAKGISPEEIAGPYSSRVDEIVRTQNRKDDDVKKSKQTMLKIPISQYDLETIQMAVKELKYDSPEKLIADMIKPVIDGGFSGFSFGKAGLAMMRLMEKHGVGKLPVPKFIDNIKSKIS
jgi:hypothetical protein